MSFVAGVSAAPQLPGTALESLCLCTTRSFVQCFENIFDVGCRTFSFSNEAMVKWFPLPFEMSKLENH